MLAAAICGNSTHVVQGTAGTTEYHIKYSWNVAMVIASGQSRDSPIPSPIMTSMQLGQMGRCEELTRCSSDVQDGLISIFSEKYLTVGELKGDNVVFAQPGFNIIATANARDRGVNDLSTALKRRSNSTAEQIGVVEDAMLHGQFFGGGSLAAESRARSLVGTLVRRTAGDLSGLSPFAVIRLADGLSLAE